MFERFLMGPLMDESGGGGGGGGASAFSAEQKAELVDLFKPIVNDAINTVAKVTKKENLKGAQAAQDQMDQLKSMLSGMKPKKAAKFLRKLGLEVKTKGKEVEPKPGETPAAGEKKTLTEEELKRGGGDFFKKRQITGLEDRIAALETENKKVKEEATEAKKLSQLDRVLSDLPWANMESRDMAREFYAPKLKWNDDGTELLIGERSFDKHILEEIPAKFENLLAPTGKGGAGTTKGQGKPGVVDIDALTNPNATADQKAEASKEIARLMGAR